MKSSSTVASSVASLVLPTVHLLLCGATASGIVVAEGSWGWFFVFLADFPFSILLLPLLDFAHPLLVFGTLGTAWWYMLSRIALGLIRMVRRVHSRVR